jgi:hypothetical protein
LPAAASGFGNPELLIKPASGPCVYQVVIGYAAKPRTDRMAHPYVQAEIPVGRLGFPCLHLPCAVVQDYFYRLKRNSGDGDSSFYELLKVKPEASLADIRLAYRLRHLELIANNASRTAHSALTRAINLLAVAELRACHDVLLADPKAPAMFPFGGFGLILVSGAPSAGRFFARRIHSFIPTVKRRCLAVPLPRLSYLPARAVYRDSRLKLELIFDPSVLPLGFQPEWNRWKHLLTHKVEVRSQFVTTGKYIRRGSEWKLVTWETALAGSIEVTLLQNVEANLLEAQRTHQRFGRYSDWIDRIRGRLEHTPMEKSELERLAAEEGIPADFDVTRINWKPDNDPLYYQQLLQRAERLYLFRDQYLFLLPSIVIAETPQAGHATYLFSRPENLDHFFRLYAATTVDLAKLPLQPFHRLSSRCIRPGIQLFQHHCTQPERHGEGNARQIPVLEDPFVKPPQGANVDRGVKKNRLDRCLSRLIVHHTVHVLDLDTTIQQTLVRPPGAPAALPLANHFFQSPLNRFGFRVRAQKPLRTPDLRFVQNVMFVL